MINWLIYDIGSHRVSCPICGRGTRDKTLGLTVNANRSGVAHCFRCAFTVSYRPDSDACQKTILKSRIEAGAPQKHETLSTYGRDLWNTCAPLSGTAASYLHGRRCLMPPADGDLRFHPALKHPSGHTGPALVGLITDAITCQPLSLHRTWIQADGKKANVDPPRLLLGRHRKKGGVIRLWPDDAVTKGLGVAEGIETALSLAWAHTPVWSCIDAGNLAAFPVLPGVEVLTIGADNDVAGIAAAQECARRWAHADREVHITKQAQNDLNDVLREAA